MTEDSTRTKALEGLALTLAHDAMGIYPQSVTGGDKPYAQRTDWMEGWNAYGGELVDTWSRVTDWLDALPADIKTTIEDYLIAGKLHLSVREDGLNLWADCSDLFFWACADGEDLAITDLPAFTQAYSESPHHGDLLWVARKRGMRPQAPYYREFSPEEQVLFDAAGPVRDDPDGKKHP